jgi:hypothetical protein
MVTKKMEMDQKEGELRGRIDGESVKRRKRVNAEHDGSSSVERRGEKRILWKNGKQYNKGDEE